MTTAELKDAAIFVMAYSFLQMDSTEKLGEIKDRANETYEPMFSMGFRIPRGEEDDTRRED